MMGMSSKMFDMPDIKPKGKKEQDEDDEWETDSED